MTELKCLYTAWYELQRFYGFVSGDMTLGYTGEMKQFVRKAGEHAAAGSFMRKALRLLFGVAEIKPSPRPWQLSVTQYGMLIFPLYRVKEYVRGLNVTVVNCRSDSIMQVSKSLGHVQNDILALRPGQLLPAMVIG
uniref:Uncharacterized protein n=1 Tax=Salix viminalis TaxID=40686 RepID=A0A6N2LUE3_SALVM